MKKLPTPTRCRNTLLAEARQSGTSDHPVSASLLAMLGQSGAIDSYEDLLAAKRELLEEDGSTSTLTGIGRVALMREQLGCSGMVNGKCCLGDFIELLDPAVEVAISGGIKDLIDNGTAELPPGPFSVSDDVEETVELITA